MEKYFKTQSFLSACSPDTRQVLKMLVMESRFQSNFRNIFNRLSPDINRRVFLLVLSRISDHCISESWWQINRHQRYIIHMHLAINSDVPDHNHAKGMI